VKRLLRSRVAIVISTAVVTAVACLGVTNAFSADAPGPVIHGCVAPNGLLRVITATQQCHKGEQPIQWNQRGPQGPPGVQGTPGPPGPPGPAGSSNLFALTVRTAGAGQGIVHGNNIDCGTMHIDCTAVYPAGAHVTLTADASRFSALSAFSGDCSGTSCTLTMDAAKSVTATFVPNATTLTATKVGASLDGSTLHVGDTMQWTVTIRNTGAHAADAIKVHDVGSIGCMIGNCDTSGWSLIAGSVTTSLGVVDTGNNAGDTVVDVTINELPAGANATIRFNAQAGLVSDVKVALNQAHIQAANADPIDSVDPNFPITGVCADLASFFRAGATCVNLLP
jgi:uncharacterized repeat protein (TIGR01451 family)